MTGDHETAQSESQPTVHLVDDDAAMRRSTGLLLRTAGLPVLAFESATAFLEVVAPGQAGCLVLDLHMPGMSGMDLVQAMRKRGYTMPVIILSGMGSIPVAVEGMKLGLFDFLVKPTDPDRLLAKVRAALETDGRERGGGREVAEIRSRLSTLTPRELELLDHIVGGLANKNIASAMGISIKTVENHRANLMAKAQASNVADLVRMKMRVGETRPAGAEAGRKPT